jgi:hypothetical protein
MREKRGRLDFPVVLEDAAAVGRPLSVSSGRRIKAPVQMVLRHALQKSCDLPGDSYFVNTRPDWILILLNNARKELRVKLMLLFWRVWHHRNDNVLGKGDCSISASVNFLESYLTSLNPGTTDNTTP